MKKNIAYRGLVANVSAHDATDGELGSVLNLIPEDGALKPLELPSAGGGTYIGGSSCSVVAVHGVNGQLNYIICCTEGTPKYFWKASTDTEDPTAFDDFTTIANGVVAIGNILCFAFDDGVKYAVWENGGYTVVTNFGYTANVKTDSSTPGLTYVYMGDTFPELTYTQGDTIANVTKENSRNFFLALDSALNKIISESVTDYDNFKYTSVGFCALKMYDGTYTMFSDLFILAPAENWPYEEIRLFPDEKAVRTSGWSRLCAHSIRIDMSNTTALKKIISSAVVFLSPPLFLRNVDKSYQAEKPSGGDSYHLEYDNYTNKELLEQLENMSFYKSIEIPISEFNRGYKYLTNISESSESLSLADMRRNELSGKIAYAYNNRLHLGNVANVYSSAYSVSVQQTFDTTSGLNPDPGFIGQVFNQSATSKAEVKALVTFADGSVSLVKGYYPWPLPPIVMFPDMSATYIDKLCMKVGNDYYMYSQIPLTSSTNWGCAYNVNFDSGLPRYNINNHIQDDGCTSTEYDNFESTYGGQVKTVYSASLLKVSEVENPFVFPAANTVAVGNGTILAMAANTKPVSEGQFGDYPLYVFTDEATWALNLNNTGTYVSRHPVSRDVISNVKSLTPIDDAVLFGTKRGVMMLAGSKTLCITDVLDGVPFLYMHMPLAVDVTQDGRQDVAIQRGLGYVNFHTFLTGAEMLFDYQAQRLFLYNTSYDYVYVYSFKSKMWGACANTGISGGISVASGSLVMLTANNENYVQEVDTRYPTGTVEVFACTRPLRFEGEHVFKTIDALLVRGNFDKAHLSTILYGANEVYVDPTKATYDNWHAVNSSQTHRLLNHPGTPYKWYRVAFVGCIKGSESVNGFDVDLRARWNNKLR